MVAGRDWGGIENSRHIRDRSCLLRCSLLLKALLQNWHLYFLSGCAREGFRVAGVDVAEAEVVGRTATFAPGILTDDCRVGQGKVCDDRR